MKEGIYSMKKKLWIIPAILLISLLVLQGCTPAAKEPAATATAAPEATVTDAPVSPTAAPDEPAAQSDELVLTLDELSQYNGKDGSPAYIAIDGVIYDVSEVSEWFNGAHNGFTAGNDLTEEIKTISPHGVSKLRGLPVVGKLAE